MTRCSYCERELVEGRDSVTIVGGRVERDGDTLERPTRIVCGDCLIAVMDAVLRPQVEVSR